MLSPIIQTLNEIQDIRHRCGYLRDAKEVDKEFIDPSIIEFLLSMEKIHRTLLYLFMLVKTQQFFLPMEGMESDLVKHHENILISMIKMFDDYFLSVELTQPKELLTNDLIAIGKKILNSAEKYLQTWQDININFPRSQYDYRD